MGEALYGTGAQYSRLLGLMLGTGLRSAFVAARSLITDGDNILPPGWLHPCMFENQRADDVFSTRGLLARLRERGIQATDVASAIHDTDQNALAQVFALFGADLGTFLQRFISSFRADAVLVMGGIAETWKCFAPLLSRALSVRVMNGRLGRRAALLGAAALYF